MKKNLLLLLSSLILLSCFQTGSELLMENTQEQPLTFTPEKRIQTAVPETIDDSRREKIENSFPPEKIIQAYKKAYPDKIREISYRNDDWAMKVYDQWYYWAGGRLLPEELVIKKGDYNSHVFNHYPSELPPFTELPLETKEKLDRLVEERKQMPLQRHPGFLNSLWRIYDRETSWARVKTTWFLGFKMQIHRDLLEDLAAVEEEIQRRMLVDSSLTRFVRSLNRIDGYNWRQIAETETLSVHSYGVALDLILNTSGGKEVYWLWTQNKGLKFYNTPYKSRFSPPDSFIKAFEKQGFIWGGKWLFFDTIHFEYRPEIMILNELPLE